MNNIIKLWTVNVIALFVVDKLLSGVAFTTFSSLCFTALALGILNACVKPILKVLTFPLTFLTLGLFSVVVNAIVLVLAFNLTDGAYMSSFGTAVFASLILAVVNSVIDKRKG